MINLHGKYFIDEEKYNCPFCKNKGVKYLLLGIVKFNETKDKYLFSIFVECSHCHYISMHLSKYDFSNQDHVFLLLSSYSTEYRTYSEHLQESNEEKISFCKKFFEITYPNSNSTYLEYMDISDNELIEIDKNIIMNIPSSFFIIDDRIPRKFRDLIAEADKCVKNNCLTGASACIRKTIYEFIVKENLEGDDYDSKIKSMKIIYPNLDNTYVDLMSKIQGITSDQVHERSYENFNSEDAKAYIELLKEIFNEIYVIPDELISKHKNILSLFSNIKKNKKQK